MEIKKGGIKYSGYLNWNFKNVFKVAEELRGRCFTFCSGHLNKREYIGGLKRGREGIEKSIKERKMEY